MAYRRCQKGAALLISMIVLAVLSAWAVSIYSMSGAAVQLAENQRKANRARANAESGLDILRFWLGRVYMPGTTAASDRFSSLSDFLQTDLVANGISNIPIAIDVNVISIGNEENAVVLNSSAAQYFSAQIQQCELN